MTVNIASKDVKITPDITEQVNKKLSIRLRKYSSNIDAGRPVNVRVSERKPNTRVDVDMPYLNFYIHAEAVTTDGILGGIDRCMDILDRQIAKYKSRLNKVRTKGGKLKKDILDIVPDAVLNPSAHQSDDDAPYKLVKVEGKPQPMLMDEAVLQMEVLDYKFLVFVNSDTDEPCVIYKRDDGNIGLIEI